MDTGELIARGSVWIALLAYPAGPWGCGRRRSRAVDAARAVWALGAAAFLVHAVASFAAFYDWSHDVAVRETARLTAETTGTSTGVGLWLNYAFTLLWVADAAWWLASPETHRTRGRFLDRLLHGFFLFMIVNGAVVFVHGPRRLLGLAVTLAGLAALVDAERRRTT